MSRSSDLKSKMIHEYLESGDVVVGSYNKLGAPIKAGLVAGDHDELTGMQETLSRHAQISGGLQLNVNKMSKKKIPKRIKSDKDSGPLNPSVTAAELELDNYQSPSGYKKTIYLHNNLGKIRMNVLAVLNCEYAYGLIFASEDDIVLTPSVGEELILIDEYGDSHKIYYANLFFSLPNSQQKLMILIKND
jgi:hypothetical protein